MRSTMCMIMLVLCVFALQCTVSTAEGDSPALLVPSVTATAAAASDVGGDGHGTGVKSDNGSDHAPSNSGGGEEGQHTKKQDSAPTVSGDVDGSKSSSVDHLTKTASGSIVKVDHVESEEDDGKNKDTAADNYGEPPSDDVAAQTRSSDGRDPAKPADKEAELSSHADPKANVSDAKVLRDDSPVSRAGALAPNGRGKPTGQTVSTEGRDITELSDKKDHSSLASTAAASASAGLNNPHSSSAGTPKSGTINSSPGGTGVGVSAGSAGSAGGILPGKNKDQTQDSTKTQAKIHTSQTKGNEASSATSSHLPLPQQPTQEKKDTTNNNKQQTRGQGNAVTTTDPKTVSNVPTHKSATKTPKPEPVLTSDTGSKIHSTTTTTMADDLQPISDANETSKTSTTTLAKQKKTLGQLQTLDKNDGSRSTPLLFAFATLVTLAIVSVVNVS